MADRERRASRGVLRPWIGEPPPNEPPVLDGYTVVAREQFDIVRMSLVGLVAMLGWWLVFAALIEWLGGREIGRFIVTFWSFVGGVVIALVLVPLLHEAVHGLAAMTVGERPSFGIGPGFFYTTIQRPVNKPAYLLIALAPLVILSVAGVALAAVWDELAGLALLFLIVNASGAIGDLWMAWRIAFQPGDALFVDLAEGFAVLVPSDPASDGGVSDYSSGSRV